MKILRVLSVLIPIDPLTQSLTHSLTSIHRPGILSLTRRLIQKKPSTPLLQPPTTGYQGAKYAQETKGIKKQLQQRKNASLACFSFFLFFLETRPKQTEKKANGIKTLKPRSRKKKYERNKQRREKSVS